MLATQYSPLREIELESYYISYFSRIIPKKTHEEQVQHTNKQRNLNHLRRVQRTNFMGRAVIKIIDLFQPTDRNWCA